MQQSVAGNTIFGLGRYTRLDGSTGQLADVQFAGAAEVFSAQADDSVAVTPGAITSTGTGDDRIQGSGSADRIEAGAGADRVAGDAGDDLLFADSGADIIDGGADNDRILAGKGDDLLLAGAGNDIAFGELGADRLQGGDGDDVLYGGDGLDVLDGGPGNDRLYGGSGADRMQGDTGNDVFVIGHALDTVIEEADGGTDTVLGYVDVQAPPNVENIVLAGITNLQATGNALDNALYGNQGANRLDGGGGVDFMAGGAGDDVYVVDAAEDVVLENADGTTWGVDTVLSSAERSVLPANVENLVLTGDAHMGIGNASVNLIQGHAGANTLVAVGDGDTLEGGDGDDTLQLDGAPQSRFATFNGGRGADTASGGAGGDTYLFGLGDGSDTIIESATPDAGAIDTLQFGAGIAPSDIAIARAGLDAVFTHENGHENGPDRIVVQGWFDPSPRRLKRIAFADGTSWSMAQVSERMPGIEGTIGADQTTGTAGSDLLDGRQGADVLRSDAGDDHLVGGAGDDFLDGGAGTDTAVFSGRVEDYALLAYRGLLYVGDTVAGRDGIDRLTGLEQVVFLQSPGPAKAVNSLRWASPLAYIASHADLMNMYGADPVMGLVHFQRFGVAQGRRVSFDGLGYLASNADLADAFGVDAEAAARHYITAGRAQGRMVRIAVQDVVDPQGVHAYVQRGTEGDDAMRSLGSSAANTLMGGRGNDTLAGGAGSDAYVLARGDGADRIREDDDTAAGTDTVVFGAGIAADQLWFRQAGDDLEVSVIGSADMITVADWYLGAGHHVEQFRAGDGRLLLDGQVQALVEAMASFSPPSAGQTTLPASLQASLSPVIAANWQ